MRKVNIAAVIVAVGSLWATDTVIASNDPTASGRLTVVSGDVLIQRSVRTDTAAVESVVGVGDTIITTDAGKTQWLMSDTSIFAMAPDSGLKINKYALPSPKNPGGLASYTLLKGAIHTVTGKIGVGVAGNEPRSVYSAATDRFSASNLLKVAAAPAGPYTLKTSVAVITAKAADFTVEQTDKALRLLLKAGSATVCTVAGCATPAAGEGVRVACDGCKPEVVAGASLDMDVLVASLEFNLQAVAALIRTDQVGDGRVLPLTATQHCRTVLARIEGSANCDRADRAGPPVSPN